MVIIIAITSDQTNCLLLAKKIDAISLYYYFAGGSGIGVVSAGPNTGIIAGSVIAVLIILGSLGMFTWQLVSRKLSTSTFIYETRTCTCISFN